MQILRPTLFLSFGLLAATACQAAGYLEDGSGAVVRSGHGDCWRTASWTPAHATLACDPALVAAPPSAVRETVPAPQPMPAPVAMPQRERMVLATDALFDFDGAELRPFGREKLDAVAKTILGAAAVDSVLVVGHTDRLGRHDYNHALSQRRAEAVKDYLVAQGITAGWIETAGRADDEPATAAGACPGKARTPQLIACLQADRRVEVEVVVHREQR